MGSGEAIKMITTNSGTATTPLITALQNSAPNGKARDWPTRAQPFYFDGREISSPTVTPRFWSCPRLNA